MPASLWGCPLMFLTQAELTKLTGYVYPARQRRWLKDNLVPFSVNRLGKPTVMRSVLESQFGGNVSRPRKAPNFDAVHGQTS